eukprot:88814-Rhodomonas_salina.1
MGEQGGFTPLHMAVQGGHCEVADRLIAARCNVDHLAKVIASDQGYTRGCLVRGVRRAWAGGGWP